MTNVQEIFDHIAVKGQHPRMLSDTYLLLEQLGHRLNRESERCFAAAEAMGLSDRDITNYIEQHIDVANVLRESAPVWDGGYVVCGITGSGETFVLRDPWGIRPAFWYKNDEVFALASERPVLQTTFDLEVDEIVELQPGQASSQAETVSCVWNKSSSRRRCRPARLSACTSVVDRIVIFTTNARRWGAALCRTSSKPSIMRWKHGVLLYPQYS